MHHSTHERKDGRPSNIDQTISYLRNAFTNATRNLGFKNHKGTNLYDYQVEFSWIMHEITNGSWYAIPDYVKKANELIDEINGNSTSKK